MSEHASIDAPAPVVERRRVPRLRSLLTGTILFDDKTTMDCQVRNISAYGAKVVLADAFRLPDEFELRIPHHDQTHHANIIWRRGDAAGLELSDVHENAHRKAPRMTPREREIAHRKELNRPMF
jgi:hypothetical protein